MSGCPGVDRSCPRTLSLAAGLIVLAYAWWGPLPMLGAHAFSTHMTVHLAVVAVAAPLIALGLAGGVLDPARRWPRFFAPLPASLVELVVVWGWHAPSLHGVSRESAAAFAAEQLSFLLAGLLLWLSAFGGDARRRAERAGAGIAGLLLTSMHMTLLGTLLALAPRPLYEHVGHAALDPLQDQQLGGVLMLVAGGFAYLAGGLALLAELLRAGDRAPPRVTITRSTHR